MSIPTDTGAYLRGSACGLAAVSIWAVWMPVTRLSVTTTLTPFDLIFFRFRAADDARWWFAVCPLTGTDLP